ncbi:unnamed protein product [Pleuronectes platessa]|uniref:Uncharacterized protein n=1 Tax=Pleuronectes platessa TaxID=8262 RepID=A0A9N7UYX5_PLEPL|nr:unnamed protein product [Pleuronectes platessa]
MDALIGVKCIRCLDFCHIQHPTVSAAADPVWSFHSSQAFNTSALSTGAHSAALPSAALNALIPLRRHRISVSGNNGRLVAPSISASSAQGRALIGVRSAARHGLQSVGSPRVSPQVRGRHREDACALIIHTTRQDLSNTSHSPAPRGHPEPLSEDGTVSTEGDALGAQQLVPVPPLLR